MLARTRLAHTEHDRLARAGAGCRLLVFGFWTGALPKVSRLHFITVADALPPESRYVLFTDQASISGEMEALLDSRGIEVIEFDLMSLLKELGAGSLVRRTPLSPLWPLVQRLARRPDYRRFLSWCGHRRERAFTPRANLLLGGPPVSGVVLSNYARAAISTVVPQHTLYCDIDFAFPRSLDWIFRHRSFVYRWEQRGYANSALMSVTADSPIKSGALMDRLVREGAGRSWILVDDRNCTDCGLDVLPCDRLDPLWSPHGPHGPAYDGFFERSQDAAAELAFLKQHYDAIHWHNKWKETPEPGSPYALWLNELEGGNGAAARRRGEPDATAPSRR